MADDCWTAWTCWRALGWPERIGGDGLGRGQAEQGEGGGLSSRVVELSGWTLRTL